MRYGWICLIGFLTVVGSLKAAEPDAFAPVATLLEQRCVRCHSESRPQGGLALVSRDAMLKGGDSGPALVPGQAANSLLIEKIIGPKPEMPAEGAALTNSEVRQFRHWIDSGATWPTGRLLRERPAGESWWSYQPVQHQAIPDVQNRSWARSPIDSFVMARLEPHQINPSPAADRRTLIRRLTMDLHGLPAAPEDVDAFLNDAAPDAVERLIDRLLASPHYGERWSRHWLDIAHYADTHGFERDQRRDNAWRYRDWVIQAFNADLPYARFLEDQLAGDALRPEDPAAITATGFLAAGPWDFVGQAETPSPVLKRLARADDLDDMVTQVMTALCGVTINCARCHDHKLDPITQREYYGLWAVFAGVRRGDRDVNPREVEALARHKQTLNAELQQVRRDIARKSGQRRDLADLVAGGDGLGTGQPGAGIDPLTGQIQTARRGFLDGAKPNVFAATSIPGIDGVVIPDLVAEGTPISSTGLRIKTPRTSGQAWDAIRSGPVNSQFSTVLDGVDYGKSDHTLLALHANAAITFDLEALRRMGAPAEMKFTATGGYFGETPTRGATLSVYLDGVLKVQKANLGRSDGGQGLEVPLPKDARFLTLMATDGGNGISHDQIGFADPWLVALNPPAASETETRELERLTARRAAIENELTSLPNPGRVYAIQTESPPPIRVLQRGDPEQPAETVGPRALSCITALPPDLGTDDSNDAQRRIALARWMTAPENPLTARVIVNRLWHYHFGVGLVETPSDFGVGGSLPSHPDLLDWLAAETGRKSGSLKAIHRSLCTSAVYRQQSTRLDGHRATSAAELDSGNRLLWRMNPRRLDAESVRDAVLSVSGCLNDGLGGPGYRDFDYQEEYAPVYRYICAEGAPLWRRSIYRFAVRTTTHPFLTTLDCPSPANLAPVRNTTTTALQSLALLNNEFMLRQSRYFAKRVEATAESPDERVDTAFRLALNRLPSVEEMAAAQQLAERSGLEAVCRALFNSNEFIYVD